MKPLLFLATAALLCGCRGTPQSSDPRLPVALTPEQRAAVIAEMNTMLRSVNSTLIALERRDPAQLAAAVQPSGMAAAADPALEAVLPARWKELAETVHGGFDSLAAVARATPAGGGALGEAALPRLTRVSTGCVTCHATFRLQ